MAATVGVAATARGDDRVERHHETELSEDGRTRRGSGYERTISSAAAADDRDRSRDAGDPAAIQR